MKACFMGLGYIGLPTAIVAADNGIDVIGVDINPHVVETVNKGQIHIVEPTPFTGNHEPDISYVFDLNFLAFNLFLRVVRKGANKANTFTQ